MAEKCVAIILGAGSGTRMNSDVNKHLLLLEGKPLLQHTIEVFDSHPLVDSIILVGPQERYNALLAGMKIKKHFQIVAGGDTRQASCSAGVFSADDADIVIIHDGARPLVSHGTITDVVNAAKEFGAALAAVPTKDTIKETDAQGFVRRTPDRKTLWQAQTPQAMRLDLARQAHTIALEEGFIGTDDVSLVENLGHAVKVIRGDYANIKLTTQEDIFVAENILKKKKTTPAPKLVTFRTGLGQDSHRFVSEENPKSLVLGGLQVAEHRGMDANSDGDVILHAIFNALSQAIGKYSLGHYADRMYKEEGITDSRAYLKVARDMVAEAGYKINNIGVSIECKTPRISPIADALQASVAKLLDIYPEQVGISATSGDGLTAFGRGEGIQVWAVANLQLRENEH